MRIPFSKECRYVTNFLHLYVTTYYILCSQLPFYCLLYALVLSMQISPQIRFTSNVICLQINTSPMNLFLQFVWQYKPFQWKVLPFGLAVVPRVFISLTKPALSLRHYKELCVIIYSDDILVISFSKCASKKSLTFLCSHLVCLRLHIFPSLTFISHSNLHLRHVLEYSRYVWLYAFWQTSWDSAVGSCFITQATCYSPSGCVLFGQDHLMCQWPCTTLMVVPCDSEWHVECLSLFCSFLSFCLSLPTLHQLQTSSWCGNHYQCYTLSLGLLYLGLWGSCLLLWLLV